MLDTIRKSAMTVAALGALGLGGAAIAGAADNSTSSGTSSSGTASQARPARAQRDALSGAVAAKVKAAALAKVPGAAVLRTEAGGPYGTAYHAHIRTSDGTPKVVLVDSSFTATAVQADRGRGGWGGRGRHGAPGGPGGPGETALTGTTKQKVEAAVLARYAGATIVRTETNRDSSAPYESHITASGGRQLEVLVSRDFNVVDANAQPAHP
jgi:hypothetical protein